MKHKIGILMVTITLLLIAFTMSVKAECAANGDLNGDKLVNQYDVDVVVNMAKGLEPVNLCADFDGDGFVGPADMSLLRTKSIREKNDSFIPTLEESGITGDVNNDGKIDYKDNDIILEIAKGKVKATKSADVDGDGFAGPADLSLIRTYIKMGLAKGLLGQSYSIETDEQSNDTETNQTENNQTNITPEEPFVYNLPFNPNCEKMTADLNNDHIIDDLDEEPMVEIAKGLETPTLCADLDLDGFVGPADISKLRSTVKMDIPRYNITFEPNPELFNGECSAVIGDVNKDSKANYQDIGLVLKMVKGQFPLSACADLDKDGFAGPADLSILRNIEKGLPVHCSITNNCTVPVNETEGNQTDNNQTNETIPGNETEDENDQGEDNDDQGNQTNSTGNQTDNNQTNSTGNQTNNGTSTTHRHKSHGSSSYSGSSSGGTAVFRVYNELAENVVEEQLDVNATVVKVAEKPKNTTAEKKEDEKMPEVVITSEPQENIYKPSMLMIGAMIALVIASLGITGVYISDTIRKKKAFA